MGKANIARSAGVWAAACLMKPPVFWTRKVWKAIFSTTIYHLYPKVCPVMDSRIDVYGSELAREYFASRDDPLKFFQYLNKYNVGLILLRKSQKNLQINQYLNYIPATKLLLETKDRLLFSYDPMLLPPEILQPKAP